jgi:hypothetical protein
MPYVRNLTLSNNPAKKKKDISTAVKMVVN